MFCVFSGSGRDVFLRNIEACAAIGGIAKMIADHWQRPSSVTLGLEPLLSGLNLLDMVHGVDSTCVRAFGDDLGHERGSTPCGTRIASFTIF